MNQYNLQYPVMDNHCHICFPAPLEDSVKEYRTLFAQLGIREAGLLSCPASSHADEDFDVLENLKMLYLKETLPIPCFAYAGFTWHTPDPQANADFGAQMLEMGFDGFKTLEQHPRVRKLIGKSLADPSLEGFFELANANKNVMVCHVGDPVSSWDLSTASQSAIEMGRVYADGFLTLEMLREEMETVIARYPDMHFILAHFYFLSDAYARVCRLLEEHPNVYLDLTPGTEMFFNFSKDPDLWREFFLRYSHRIIMGSDHYAQGYGAGRYRLVRNFLEGTEPFLLQDRQIQPIGLPREALENIYGKNVHRLLGKTPKPVNAHLAYAHGCQIRECYGDSLSPLAQENLEIMLRFWSRKREENLA